MLGSRCGGVAACGRAAWYLLRRLLGADVRALGALRASLGLIVLVDTCACRFPDACALYSDEGVDSVSMQRGFASEQDALMSFSLLYVNGSGCKLTRVRTCTRTQHAHSTRHTAHRAHTTRAQARARTHTGGL